MRTMGGPAPLPTFPPRSKLTGDRWSKTAVVVTCRRHEHAVAEVRREVLVGGDQVVDGGCVVAAVVGARRRAAGFTQTSKLVGAEDLREELDPATSAAHAVDPEAVDADDTTR